MGKTIIIIIVVVAVIIGVYEITISYNTCDVFTGKRRY